MRGNGKRGSCGSVPWVLPPRLPGIQACSVWLLSPSKSKTAEAETPKKHGNARVPHPHSHLRPVLSTYLHLGLQHCIVTRACEPSSPGSRKTDLVELMYTGLMIFTLTTRYMCKCK